MLPCMCDPESYNVHRQREVERVVRRALDTKVRQQLLYNDTQVVVTMHELLTYIDYMC